MSGYVQIKDLPVADTVITTDQFVLQRADGTLYKVLGSTLIGQIAGIVSDVITPVLPTNYPGLICWYQPSGLASVGVSGFYWTAWNDSSGHGRDLASHGQVSMRSLNGLPAIGAGSTDSYMQRVSTGTEFTNNSYTIITVLRGGLSDFVVKSVTSDNRIIGQSFGGSPALVNFQANDSNGLSVIVTAGQTTNAVIVVSTLNALTGVFTTYMNGGTYSSAHPTWKATQNFQGTVKVGSFMGTSDNLVAETFAYDSVRTTHEINNLCQQLATKFAINWISI
jgi:hypothetical protein